MRFVPQRRSPDAEGVIAAGRHRRAEVVALGRISHPVLAASRSAVSAFFPRPSADACDAERVSQFDDRAHDHGRSGPSWRIGVTNWRSSFELVDR